MLELWRRWTKRIKRLDYGLWSLRTGGIALGAAAPAKASVRGQEIDTRIGAIDTEDVQSAHHVAVVLKPFGWNGSISKHIILSEPVCDPNCALFGFQHGCEFGEFKAVLLKVANHLRIGRVMETGSHVKDARGSGRD